MLLPLMMIILKNNIKKVSRSFNDKWCYVDAACEAVDENVKLTMSLERARREIRVCNNYWSLILNILIIS